MPFCVVLQAHYCIYLTINFFYFCIVCTVALAAYPIYNDCV